MGSDDEYCGEILLMEKKYCFGVDIGGTTTKMGLFTIDGELVEKWEIPTRTVPKGEPVLPDVAHAIQKKMSEKDIAFEEVVGIGYGAPVSMTADGYVTWSANIGWEEMNVSKKLAELTGMKVIGGNDVNVAGMGEYWRGAAQGYKNVVMITIGTGVGAAIIADGKVIVGATGGAGEVGHIHVNDDCKLQCGCGGYGCLEQYGSATAVVRLAKELLEKDERPSVMRGQEMTAKVVFDAVKEGDALAIEVAEQFGDAIGKGLAAVVAVVEPEAFIVGGGVSKAGDVVLDYIKKYYQKYAYPAAPKKEFLLASLGNDAGIYGGAYRVLFE